MRVDNKTLQDLSVFHKAGGLYDKLNLCLTTEGSQWLKQYMNQPPSDYEILLSYQESIRYWHDNVEAWCHDLTNGTLVMTEKYFNSVETITAKPNTLSLFLDKMMSKVNAHHEQSLLKFSITQVMDFVKACDFLVQEHLDKAPSLLKKWLEEMQQFLLQQDIQNIIRTPDTASYKELLTLSYYTRRESKRAIEFMIKIFAKIDGIRALGLATKQYQYHFPEILPQDALCVELNNCFHPLIKGAVPYNLKFNKQQHFLFLTGANMSGKSTLIRSLGLSVYMAHLGMGIPAKASKISFFNSLITNMQIEDNIFLGESYFFAEVQRVKNTALQIAQAPYNLVLMDELFKGTNVHDAYECTAAIIQAMSQSDKNIMALSTHLYELGEEYKTIPVIQQMYCETIMTADNGYKFTYQLRQGVSNDRIGYLVLQKEGVLDILANI